MYREIHPRWRNTLAMIFSFQLSTVCRLSLTLRVMAGISGINRTEHPEVSIFVVSLYLQHFHRTSLCILKAEIPYGSISLQLLHNRHCWNLWLPLPGVKEPLALPSSICRSSPLLHIWAVLGLCRMQEWSCAWAGTAQTSQGSPGTPLGSCLVYHFRNILAGCNSLKLNLSCCSLHSHSPRISASVENPNKCKLQESPFPRAGHLSICVALESFVGSVLLSYISTSSHLCFCSSSLAFKYFLQQINCTGNIKEIPLNPEYMF